MLERAREKLGPAVTLQCTVGETLPVADASADVVFGSFVLSYIEAIDSFAEECARVTRAGATVVLSDMHPVTAAARGWKRSFEDGAETIELDYYPHSLSLVLAAFRRHGFELLNLLEPWFGEPERELFAVADRLSKFDNLATLPAIYILKLERVTAALPRLAASGSALSLIGARYALSPVESGTGPISIQDGRIAFLTDHGANCGNALDLREYLLLPGLVNAHDHLEFALFPNLGRPADIAPYRNAGEWAEEIHRKHADVIALHRAVPRETCLWWGAIRNLLCGVTSVCHHNEIYPLLRDFVHVNA